MLKFMWIPVVVIFYIVHSLISYKINMGCGMRWVIMGYLLGFLPVWIWVCKVSDNLLRDGLIFDTLLVATCAITYTFLGYGHAFTLVQWAGVIVATIGFLIIQFGDKF